MNKYHPNINLTTEANLSKFLGTKFHPDNNETKCFVYHREMKLPFHCVSAISKHSKRNVVIRNLHLGSATPKHSKKNCIIGDLYLVKNLGANFEQEVGIIRNKHIKASHPFDFINSAIGGFNQETEDP